MALARRKVKGPPRRVLKRIRPKSHTRNAVETPPSMASR